MGKSCLKEEEEEEEEEVAAFKCYVLHCFCLNDTVCIFIALRLGFLFSSCHFTTGSLDIVYVTRHSVSLFFLCQLGWTGSYDMPLELRRRYTPNAIFTSSLFVLLQP